MDNGPGSTTFTMIYQGTSLTYDAVPPTLGVIYTFEVRAYNAKGYSDFSMTVSAAFGDPADKPAAPVLDKSQTNSSYAMITWTEGTSSQLAILGYQLYADNAGNNQYSLIYDGSNSPNVFEYLHGPLITGATYNYMLTSVTFNGPSVYSPVLSIQVCSGP